MQLTLYTDYALRVLLYLGLKKDQATISEIATSFRISKNHLVKVVHALARREVIESTRGKNGGIRLRVDPEKIRLGRFVFETEPHSNLVECFNREENTCPIIGICRLENLLYQARNDFYKSLDRYTLADLISSSVSGKSKDPRLARLGIRL